uniref:FAM21/CAPZIP domain-containing protein n=1 Tax=Timema cristinae TaxID=61476 RepID=A0A7R9CBM4_TIMCR|nr:unnamed protein product [Timema cristinae]
MEQSKKGDKLRNIDKEKDKWRQGEREFSYESSLLDNKDEALFKTSVSKTHEANVGIKSSDLFKEDGVDDKLFIKPKSSPPHVRGLSEPILNIFKESAIQKPLSLFEDSDSGEEELLFSSTNKDFNIFSASPKNSESSPFPMDKNKPSPENSESSPFRMDKNKPSPENSESSLFHMDKNEPSLIVDLEKSLSDQGPEALANNIKTYDINKPVVAQKPKITSYTETVSKSKEKISKSPPSLDSVYPLNKTGLTLKEDSTTETHPQSIIHAENTIKDDELTHLKTKSLRPSPSIHNQNKRAINPGEVLVRTNPPTEKTKQTEAAVNFDKPARIDSILHSAGKDRAKIPIKRRPQSRQARQEALRKDPSEDYVFDDSTLTFPKNSDSSTLEVVVEDFTDSIKKKNDFEATQVSLMPLDNTSNEVTINNKVVEGIPENLVTSPGTLVLNSNTNPLSPSTDEEDFFGVPQYLPSEYGSNKDLIADSNKDLFGDAPMLSPLDFNDTKSNIVTGLEREIKNYDDDDADDDANVSTFQSQENLDNFEINTPEENSTEKFKTFQSEVDIQTSSQNNYTISDKNSSHNKTSPLDEKSTKTKPRTSPTIVKGLIPAQHEIDSLMEIHSGSKLNECIDHDITKSIVNSTISSFGRESSTSLFGDDTPESDDLFSSFTIPKKKSGEIQTKEKNKLSIFDEYDGEDIFSSPSQFESLAVVSAKHSGNSSFLLDVKSDTAKPSLTHTKSQSKTVRIQPLSRLLLRYSSNDEVLLKWSHLLLEKLVAEEQKYSVDKRHTWVAAWSNALHGKLDCQIQGDRGSIPVRCTEEEAIELMTGETLVKAKGLYHSIMNFQFILALDAIVHVIKFTLPLSRQLQSPKLDIGHA